MQLNQALVLLPSTSQVVFQPRPFLWIMTLLGHTQSFHTLFLIPVFLFKQLYPPLINTILFKSLKSHRIDKSLISVFSKYVFRCLWSV